MIDLHDCVRATELGVFQHKVGVIIDFLLCEVDGHDYWYVVKFNTGGHYSFLSSDLEVV
jgi:hypothetical protein